MPPEHPGPAAAALRAPDDPLLTLAEVAEILRVSGRTLRRWRAAKLIHAQRIGSVERIRSSEVEQMLAEPQASSTRKS